MGVILEKMTHLYLTQRQMMEMPQDELEVYLQDREHDCGDEIRHVDTVREIVQVRRVLSRLDIDDEEE